MAPPLRLGSQTRMTGRHPGLPAAASMRTCEHNSYRARTRGTRVGSIEPRVVGTLGCMPLDPRDGRVQTATRASWLSALPDEQLRWLLDDGFRMDVPAGSVVYREGESPGLALVLEGLIRVYLTSADGRQVTVRYVRAGGVLGVATAVAGPVNVGVQVLTETSLVVLNVDRLRNLAQSDP